MNAKTIVTDPTEEKIHFSPRLDELQVMFNYRDNRYVELQDLINSGQASIQITADGSADVSLLVTDEMLKASQRGIPSNSMLDVRALPGPVTHDLGRKNSVPPPDQRPRASVSMPGMVDFYASAKEWVEWLPLKSVKYRPSARIKYAWTIISPVAVDKMTSKILIANTPYYDELGHKLLGLDSPGLETIPVVTETQSNHICAFPGP